MINTLLQVAAAVDARVVLLGRPCDALSIFHNSGKAIGCDIPWSAYISGCGVQADGAAAPNSTTFSTPAADEFVSTIEMARIRVEIGEPFSWKLGGNGGIGAEWWGNGGWQQLLAAQAARFLGDAVRGLCRVTTPVWIPSAAALAWRTMGVEAGQYDFIKVRRRDGRDRCENRAEDVVKYLACMTANARRKGVVARPLLMMSDEQELGWLNQTIVGANITHRVDKVAQQLFPDFDNFRIFMLGKALMGCARTALLRDRVSCSTCKEESGGAGDGGP